MTEKELAVCDECGSLFFKGSSQMMGLCPECAHILYGYPNCDHHFQDGRCVNCYWDGSKSMYIKKQNQQEETDMIARYLYLGDRETALEITEELATSRLWAAAAPTQVRPMNFFENPNLREFLLEPESLRRIRGAAFIDDGSLIRK